MEASKRTNGDHEDGLRMETTHILQEAKECFMATSVKKKKLVDVLTRCVCVLSQNNRLASMEATDLFFNITRLFQYKDKDRLLRRLVHIGIKALSKQADNVYVVTPILTNDVNSSTDDPAIRASALRALCQISDATTFKLIEHSLRQSVIDKHPVVASAAISSLVRASLHSEENISHFTNEIREALNSDSPMVQYHALGLLYNSCENDKSAESELISRCIQKGLTSPLAICLLIRIIGRFTEKYDGDEAKTYAKYIVNLLVHENTLIEYEAATNLAKLESIDESHKKSAISHLRNFLTCNKTSLRFASVRYLNELAISSADIRYWSVHRIGGVCKLHLLNKRYKLGDHIIGILDFSNSNITCAKYTVVLQCEEIQQYELKQEFSLGMRESDFMITIPLVNIKTSSSVLHCVLSFLFYIADKNYPKTLYEDRSGTIELGPSELDTKLFSCDFPIAIHCN